MLWTVAGAWAWKATSDQVHITVAEQEGSGQGPDPVALLTDQVSTLQEDLRGLTSALAENFNLLGEELGNQGESNRQHLTALKSELDGLRRDAADSSQSRTTQAIEERLARVEGLLQQVLTANEDAAERERLAQQFAEEERQREQARQQEEARLAAERQAQQAQEREAQAAMEQGAQGEVERPSRGFLSFRLPSNDFSFDSSQRFSVITSLSRVGFDAKSTLHDFSGVSQKAKGEIRVNLAHPEEGIEGELRVPAASLDTALEGRDEEMRKVLAVDEFKDLVFVPTSFDAQRIDPEAQEVEGTIHGEMTLHGQTHQVQMKVKGSIDASRRLVIEGEMPLRMSDFDVKPPSKLGMINVEDEVRVWISLRARPSGAEGQ